MHPNDYWAVFVLLQRIPSKTILKLINSFKSAFTAWQASSKELAQLNIEEKFIFEFINQRQKINTEKLFRQLENNNISVLPINNPNYPELLRQIYSPPLVLFYQGHIRLLQTCHNNLTIIGTRKHSADIKILLRNLISNLAPTPITTVSGLAHGIDSLVAENSLANNIPTIAVLGSSLMPTEIYPKNNYKLSQEIINKNNLMLSEFAPGTPINKFNFPRRNRILAGLSPATLLIEAPEKSGAMITCRLALENNRDVLVIPHSPLNTNGQGNNRLIKQGAMIVTQGEDICNYFDWHSPSETNIKKDDFTNTLEKDIIKLVANSDLTVDQLALNLTYPLPAIQTTLLSLELRQIICKNNLKYSLCK